MKDTDPSDEHADSRTDRRTVLKTAAAGLSLFGTGAVGSVSGRTGTHPTLNDFRVQGRKIQHVKVRPEYIETTTRKISPDLQRRYGPEQLESTHRHERPHPELDDLPRKDTSVYNNPWNALIAAEDEWIDLATSPNADEIMVSGAELAAQASEQDVSIDSYPDQLPKYYYNNEDGLWELSGPINILGSPFTFDGAEDCASNIASNGTGSYTWTTSVVDAARYALTGSTFQRHEESVASGPFGFTGRTHGRLWNGTDDDYVLIAAHEDSWAPHEAIAYLEAEYRIVDFMNSSKDIYDAGNDEEVGLDHNGKVSYIANT